MEPRKLVVNGAELHYIEQGMGDPIVADDLAGLIRALGLRSSAGLPQACSGGVGFPGEVFRVNQA